MSYRTKEIAPPETSADESTVAHDEDESLSDPLPPITAISENDEILDNQTNGDMSMMFVMMGLIFMVGSLSSLDRVAMSVALVPMAEEMGLSDSVKGGISSFFSIGYGLGILPAGLMLSQLSPRYIMAAGICLWSLGTIATPFSAAQTSIALCPDSGRSVRIRGSSHHPEISLSLDPSRQEEFGSGGSIL
jgi:hypothetical protein